MTTATRIRSVLAEKGMNYSDAAHATGLSRQTIARWASGKVEPRTRNLEELARALGVDRSRLVETGRNAYPVLIIEQEGSRPLHITLKAPTTITVTTG